MSRTAASITFAALCTAVWAPALVFAPGYADRVMMRVLLGCAAVASVAVTTALAGRLSRVGALLGGLLALVGVVVALAAWRPGQVPGAVPGAADALLHTGARILTTTPPAPTTVDTVTLPLAGTWLAGAAAALALRAGRPLLALLPPVVLLTGAVVLAGPDGAPGYLAVTVLVAAGATLLGAFTAAESGDGRETRAVLRAIGVAVLLAGLAAFAGPPVLAEWSRRPPDPRPAAKPPVTRDEAVNPLSYLPGWGARPLDPLLTVRTARPVELRWVTLSEFTGETWLPEQGYSPAGEMLPPPVPAPPRPTSQRATLTVANLPGPWLPAVGNPRRIEGVPVSYDPESGTLVARDGRSVGHRYAVTGDVPGWRPTDAARALVPTDPAFDRYRELPPGAPSRIGEVAAVVAGTDSPYRQAVRLAEYLRRDYVLDARGRGGHGYANLAAFLVMPGEGRRGSGTADQFASAFAVLARAAGLPSRVAVGFGQGGTDGPDGRQVRTGDALAWGEVYFDGVGWVPFDVIPGTRTASGSGAAPEGAAPTPAPGSAAPQRPEGARPAAPAAPAEKDTPDPDDSGTWVGLTVAALVVLLATPLVAVPALRRRRTRRRLHQGTPADRILGAWAELLDGLRLAGRPVPVAHTAKDVAIGHPSLEWLAVQVNAVGFGHAGDVESVQATAAVDLAYGYVRTLRRSRSRLRRLLWWLDPRPLFW
ncbi:DUF3488 and transglutaminase-like domain-containing protein [Actinomadura sp. HBU206391]|uniref:DUF3488 and transglutaminase-like domain-containing protein n=1 Tax=Actinomadura sp. HBU206391 TaxID=2731692 RepID=UPI0016505F80|nr:transglutaminase domain-containing protein [Actinomadura sp. HBU206391]MBC6462131.1 transglutaminase domain-containing protein [Actinomadura sp. HBU206391]